MKNLAIIALATILAACGNDPITNAGYFDDDVDRSNNTTTNYTNDESNTSNSNNTTTNNYYHDSVIVVHDTLTRTITTRVTDTLYVKDTLTFTDTLTVHTSSTDTIVKNIKEVVRDTLKVTVRDTVVERVVDTLKTTVHDTVQIVQYDTIYSSAQRPTVSSPLDTLDELPEGVYINKTIIKLSGNSMTVIQTPDDTTGVYRALIIQGETIDTLTTVYSREGSLTRVHPINGCIGILGYKPYYYSSTAGNYWNTKNPYKVCDANYNK